MKILFTRKALDDYQNIPKEIEQTADKQFNFLLKNFKHPSLRVKKYDEAKDVWQARITRGWRFYFRIRGDTYYIITIAKHSE